MLEHCCNGVQKSSGRRECSNNCRNTHGNYENGVCWPNARVVGLWETFGRSSGKCHSAGPLSEVSACVLLRFRFLRVRFPENIHCFVYTAGGTLETARKRAEDPFAVARAGFNSGGAARCIRELVLRERFHLNRSGTRETRNCSRRSFRLFSATLYNHTTRVC